MGLAKNVVIQVVFPYNRDQILETNFEAYLIFAVERPRLPSAWYA